MTLQVHRDDGIPLGLGHVDQYPVPQDAGVVDQHVQVTKGLDGGVDHALAALPVRDVVGVGHRLATHGFDLVNDLLRRSGVGPAAIDVAAEVVDHDLGPFRGQQQCMLSTDTAPRAGDDHNSSV